MSYGKNTIFRKFKKNYLLCHYIDAQRMLRKAVLVASLADGIHEQWKLILEAGGGWTTPKTQTQGRVREGKGENAPVTSWEEK